MLALLPSALHLDFFAAAKPLLLGTARVEVTLILSLDKWKFRVIWFIMDSQQDAILTGRLSEADSVSVPKAARALGLDVYTLYTLIQRDRVRAGLSPTGEFVIPKSEVERLAKKE